MLDLSRKLKYSMPKTQYKAIDIICNTYIELEIQCPTVEKVLHCPVSNKYYIGDIYFGQYKLLIEIDGISHRNKKKYDKDRDKRIYKELGIKTIIFDSQMIETKFFKDEIKKILKKEHRKFKRRYVKLRKKQK